MQDICRLCCSSSDVQHEIFTDEELHGQMAPFLFTPLRVRRGDGLPQRVCGACRSRVLQLHHFCGEAQRAQCRLRAMLEAGEGLVKRECDPEPHYERSTQTEDALQVECTTQTECEVKPELAPCPSCWLSNSAGSGVSENMLNPYYSPFVDIKQEIPPQSIQNWKLTNPNEQGFNTIHQNYPQNFNSSEQGYHGNNSDDFVELNNFIHVQITMSDSDEHTPLIDLKKKKKSVQKKPKKKPQSSNSKEKPKKQKAKQETKKEKDKKDSDSDGLDDQGQDSERQGRPRKSIFQTEDPYACWCCICSKTMPDREACLQHYESHLESGAETGAGVEAGAEEVPPLLPSSGRCPRCGKRQAAAAWPAHWARHQRSPHRCDLCRLSFAGLCDLVAHGVMYHAKEKDIKHDSKYMCDLCTSTFVTMKTLARHRLRLHGAAAAAGGGRPRCARCAYSARSAGCLVQHVRRKHAPQRHLCASCGKTFASTDKLKHHLLLHSGEKPFKCQYCARGFAAPGTRRDHERTHTGEKPHVCAQCGRGFAQRSALVAHVRALHARARPHACALCGKAFAAKSLLNAHLKKPCVRAEADAGPPLPPGRCSPYHPGGPDDRSSPYPPGRPDDRSSPYPPDPLKTEAYGWT